MNRTVFFCGANTPSRHHKSFVDKNMTFINEVFPVGRCCLFHFKLRRNTAAQITASGSNNLLKFCKGILLEAKLVIDFQIEV